MSSIGGPLNTSLIQAAQAQKSASEARSRERAEESRSRERRDELELRIEGLESVQAARQLPQNDSEQAEDEHRRQEPKRRPAPPEEERRHIDLTG